MTGVLDLDVCAFNGIFGELQEVAHQLLRGRAVRVFPFKWRLAWVGHDDTLQKAGAQKRLSVTDARGSTAFVISLTAACFATLAATAGMRAAFREFERAFYDLTRSNSEDRANAEIRSAGTRQQRLRFFNPLLTSSYRA
jgi:hypothetical protein